LLPYAAPVSTCASPAATGSAGINARTAVRAGVLLVNLGTPEAPQSAAIRRYLAEFLSDPRVVELPALLWQPVLHGVVLRRVGRIAARYASIWTPHGSPLLVNSRLQSDAVQALLAQRGLPVQVALAMRYGRPALTEVLSDLCHDLREQGCERILVLPLYPQYAASTTATVVDAIGAFTARLRDQPELRFVKRFHTDAGYIDALSERIRACWQAGGEPERLVMSFHSLPARAVARGDPYARDCQQTALALAEALGISPERYVVSFQSRFGRARWLSPYTETTIRELAARGVRRVDVVCPGFVADCLETLEEIEQGCRTAFLAAGGAQLRYIPALNDSPRWISALADLIARNLQGWL